MRQRQWWVALFSLSHVACDDPLPNLELQPQVPTFRPPDLVFGQPEAGTSAQPVAPTASATESELPPVLPPGQNEPRGNAALSVVHAVSDARYVYFCAEPSTDAASSDTSPVPEQGLTFGQRWLLTEQDLDFSAALTWWLIASESPLPAGSSCAQLLSAGTGPRPADAGLSGDAGAPGSGRDASVLDASVLDASALDVSALDASALDASVPGALDASVSPSPDVLAWDADAAVSAAQALAVLAPSVRVRPFVTLPAGSLATGRSYLLVAARCVGGFELVQQAELPTWQLQPADLRQLQQQWCGPNFAQDQSSLEAVFVPLSRDVEYRYFGLQFVNASALPRATLRSVSSLDAGGLSFGIANDASFGSIVPRVARSGVALADLGDRERVLLQIDVGLDAPALLQQTWAEVWRSSGEPELTNARAYSVLLLGAVLQRSVVQGVPLWGLPQGLHAPRLLLLDNDPVTAREPQAP